MEAVLQLDPSLFILGENVLRDYLPSGFVRNVVKWVPIFSDKLKDTQTERGMGDILCITRQRHLIQFDSNKSIVRTCNLAWKNVPKKTDKIDMLKFLSSNGNWYVAILFQSSCYVYLQKVLCFEKHTEKNNVKGIDVDDFWVIGSQQLKISFLKNTENNCVTDFNPTARLGKEDSLDNTPNEKVSSSLRFQVHRSKLSLQRAIKENQENEEAISGACNWLSRSFVGTQLISESDLVSRILGPEKFKNVVEFVPNATDSSFKEMKTKSIILQYRGRPILVHILGLVKNTKWRVKSISSEFSSLDLTSHSSKFHIFHNMESFSKPESVTDLIKSMFYPKENATKIDEIGEVYIIQHFDASMLHAHVGRLKSILDVSNSSISRLIDLPPIDVEDLAEPDMNQEDVLQNDIDGEVSLQKLSGILSLMKRKTVLICSIASELPKAFSDCLKQLKFKYSYKWTNFYYNFNANSDLKGIILIVRSEKVRQIKVELFAEEDNVLKLFVRKCYSIMPQDIEFSIPKMESKMKDSKLLRQKNCLFKEIVKFCNLFGNEFYENNLSNLSTQKLEEPFDLKKEFKERKRKFGNRSNHVEVPLQLFFDYQKEMKCLEEETDLAFM